MKRLPPAFAAASVAAAALLAGCSTVPTATEGGVPVDATHVAQGQDSRVLYLVLHYTVADFRQSMKILTEQQVSAHYLLSDESPPRIYRLVDEGRRAWHSGASGWGVDRRLNSSSIGIEIVHPGFLPGDPEGPDAQRRFAPFSPAQIDALIPLVQDIVRRHGIKPERVLGHGEVTPSYKIDPGPTFPWKRLADAGITPPWPDAARVTVARAVYETAPPDATWYQQALAQHGYVVDRSGRFDAQTQRVLMNFQMRYRPADYRGIADAETAALLWVLTTPDGSIPLPQPPAPQPPPPGAVEGDAAAAPAPTGAASAP